MKKILALLTVLAMVFAMAACKKDEPVAQGNDASQGEAQSKTTLVVGFDAEFPPFGYLNEDGSYDGFDLALAKEACSRLGWEYEELAINWDYKDAQLEAGDINCIWNGFTCTGREDQYTWTDAYVDNSIVMVVKEGSGISSFADLAGKQVMAQAGSSGLEAIQSREDLMASIAGVTELPDYNTGFTELDMGSVDAVAVDLGVAQYQIAKNGGAYVILDEAISTEQYAVGFKLGNTEMAEAVNNVLREMAEDGTMLSIAQNYVDEGLVIESLCMIED